VFSSQKSTLDTFSNAKFNCNISFIYKDFNNKNRLDYVYRQTDIKYQVLARIKFNKNRVFYDIIANRRVLWKKTYWK